MRVKELPRITLGRGEKVRFHLGFKPVSVQIGFFVNGKLGRLTKLTARQVPAWKATTRGILLLQARIRGSDASYAAVITFR